LAFPELHAMLIESQNKKATFLKEVVRTLKLDGVEVYSGRAEQWGKVADVVTMRAVEKFESTLPLAVTLTSTGGRICLLTSTSLAEKARMLAAGVTFQVEIGVPHSEQIVVIVGNKLWHNALNQGEVGDIRM